jgi:hypothetical protein
MKHEVQVETRTVETFKVEADTTEHAMYLAREGKGEPTNEMMNESRVTVRPWSPRSTCLATGVKDITE